MLNNKEDMESCAAAASLISALPQNDSKLNHLLVQVRALRLTRQPSLYHLCYLNRLSAARRWPLSSGMFCVHAIDL